MSTLSYSEFLRGQNIYVEQSKLCFVTNRKCAVWLSVSQILMGLPLWALGATFGAGDMVTTKTGIMPAGTEAAVQCGKQKRNKNVKCDECYKRRSTRI